MSTHPKAALMHTPSNGDVADLHGFSCFRGVSLSLFFPPFFAHSSFTFSALYYLDSCLFPAGLVGWEFRVFSVRIQSLCLLTIMTMNKLQLCTAGHGALDFLMHHLGHQQMTTDTAFSVTKARHHRSGLVFLPTLFPQQLAD